VGVVNWVSGWVDSGWVSGVDVHVLVTVCVLWCCQ